MGEPADDGGCPETWRRMWGSGEGRGCSGGHKWACCSRHRQKRHHTDTAWIQPFATHIPPSPPHLCKIIREIIRISNLNKTELNQEKEPKGGWEERWEENAWGDADMGRCVQCDHAKLMVARWCGGWWDANMSTGHAIDVRSSQRLLAFWIKTPPPSPNPGATWENLPLMGTF